MTTPASPQDRPRPAPPRSSAPSPTPAPHGRLVVGVDGSEQGALALRWALAQAVRTGAEVEAIACWQWPSYAGGFAPTADMDLAAPTGDAAKLAVDAAVAATPGAAAVTVHTRVVEGYAPQVLVDASAGAELLVVGSRGHGELRGLLLGSVGLHCASHAVCPVVVVRTGPAGT